MRLHPVTTLAIVAVLCSIGCSPCRAGEKDSTRKSLYTIGYSHLDTQWRWDYRTTIRKYIPATMRENLRLFDAYPGYIFDFSGANRYLTRPDSRRSVR
jgi:hypothetical protein